MTPSQPNSSRPVMTFLLLLFGLSGIFYWLIIGADASSGGAGLYSLGLMWCPGIAAIATLLINRRSLKELGWTWGKTSYQWRSYLIPFLYTAIAYLVIWIMGWGRFYNEETVEKLSGMFGAEAMSDEMVIALYVLIYGVLGIIPGAIMALGEEIGWRGFLVPELMKTQGYVKTSLLIGLLWGLWHLPLLLFGEYNSGTSAWFSAPCFLTLTLGVSFVYTWFRIQSGSLWTAVFLHASHNLFVQEIFSPLTADAGFTEYFVGEFGVALPVVVLGFAVYFWNKRDELPALAQ
ncbi:MAG: CPBP family intramembrane glutamic endopeptidase [Bacteroidota bacterium]